MYLLDLVVAQVTKRHVDLLESRHDSPLPSHRHARHHDVRATAQATEHLRGVLPVARFSEHVSVDDDDGVASDRHRVADVDRRRLATRQSLGVFSRRLAREDTIRRCWPAAPRDRCR